jgi:hypothetical protein
MIDLNRIREEIDGGIVKNFWCAPERCQHSSGKTFNQCKKARRLMKIILPVKRTFAGDGYYRTLGITDMRFERFSITQFGEAVVSSFLCSSGHSGRTVFQKRVDDPT